MNESHEPFSFSEPRMNQRPTVHHVGCFILTLYRRETQVSNISKQRFFFKQTEWVQMLAISRAGPWQLIPTEAADRTVLKSSPVPWRRTRGEGKLPLTIRHLQAALFYLTSLCRWAGPSGGGSQTLAINHCINLAQRENPRLAIIWS